MDSANLMKVHDIGLDMNDYRKLAADVASEAGVDAQMFAKHLKAIENDGEANGGVSFFQSFEAAERIKHYAALGGEWRELTVSNFLKSAARKLKVPYAQLKPILQKYIGSSSRAVVVVVDLPIALVANQNALGSSKEIYTKSKVSAKFIVNVIPI